MNRVRFSAIKESEDRKEMRREALKEAERARVKADQARNIEFNERRWKEEAERERFLKAREEADRAHNSEWDRRNGNDKSDREAMRENMDRKAAVVPGRPNSRFLRHYVDTNSEEYLNAEKERREAIEREAREREEIQRKVAAMPGRPGSRLLRHFVDTQNAEYLYAEKERREALEREVLEREALERAALERTERDACPKRLAALQAEFDHFKKRSRMSAKESEAELQKLRVKDLQSWAKANPGGGAASKTTAALAQAALAAIVLTMAVVG